MSHRQLLLTEQYILVKKNNLINTGVVVFVILGPMGHDSEIVLRCRIDRMGQAVLLNKKYTWYISIVCYQYSWGDKSFSPKVVVAGYKKQFFKKRICRLLLQ